GLLCLLAFRSDWSDLPFVLEHVTKVVVWFLFLMPTTAAGVAAWRLVGGRGRDLMCHPYAARTPADFWRRYNRPVTHFLEEDAFRPAGGRRAPFLATLAASAASAAI